MARAQSEQSRDLSRRITSSLLKQWVIFTVAFVLAALLLNTAFFPRLGDWIADETSEWHTLYQGNYPLKEVLDEMGFRNDDGTYDLTRLGPIDDDGLVEYESDSADSVNIVFDYFDRYDETGEFYSLVDSLETSGLYLYQLDATPGHESYIAVERDADPRGSGTLAVDSTGKTYLYVTFEEMLDSPYMGYMTLEEAERALQARALYQAVDRRVNELGIRERYMENIVTRQAPLSHNSWDWQTMWGDDGTLSYRDLSIYNFFHEWKVPVLLLLYCAGCAVIVLYALRRSLRSFDALSGAVGDIIANREEPVELPPDLAGVQDKLNNIRLTALADERAAVAAERRKDELVAYLAHDVKTPLTSVIGYLSLLDEAPDLPAGPREKYTRIAFEKACRLEGLIDEFFEITRYNLQAIPIERAWVQVKLFCEQVAEGFYVEAEARSLSIQVEAPDDARFFVDAEKLSRAVGNVVRNAIAYADPNTTIRLRAEAAEGESEPVWRISVTDRGREISQAHLKSIFDKFYREDGARGTKEGGTGLGLAIAQEIVVAHKGTITAESTDGTTTFTIRLPRLDDPLATS